MKNELLEFTEGLNQWETKPLFGLDSLYFADGPHGLRKQFKMNEPFGRFGSYQATSFPTASLTACSFDKALIEHMASCIAKEAKALNVHVVLGPGVNIKRSPLCGRNFEYFSEDPLVSGLLGASFVNGLQQAGVGASVKHFLANNQETNRYTINAVIDKRALREIYLKPFELALKANPATLMSSYNQVNGMYTNQHPLIKNVVRQEWGYEGVIISDWGAMYDKLRSIKASHDLEMPSSGGFFNKNVLPHIDDEVKENLLKTKQRLERLVTTYKKDEKVAVDFEAHHQQARQIARESMVLLKNEGILPLNKEESILICGPFTHHMRYQGNGSSYINPYKVESVASVYHQYSSHIHVTEGITIDGDFHLMEDTIELAKKVDKVVVMLGLPDEDEQEGVDREDISIPANQIHMLKAIHEVNQHIVIVLVGGSVIDLSFDTLAQGVLLASLSGGAGASALMDILYGFSPSGRLAETYIHKLSDANVTLTDDNASVYYDESIYVGYRYYDTFNVDVKYPFGYGLSYSEFEYSQFYTAVDQGQLSLSFNLKNTGLYDTKEVIQIYIGGPQSSVFKPLKELRYFDKVFLRAGEDKTIFVTIPLDDLRFYDLYQDRYILEEGTYHVYLAKHVNETLFKQALFIEGEEIIHPNISYLNGYDTSDFNKLYHLSLPKKQLKRKRPYTLNHTLSDLRNTVLGRLVSRYMIKLALKEMASLSEKQNALNKKVLLTTPLRVLALYGGEAFNLDMASGVVDIVNFKLFKGLRKLRKI